jgi:hypothetical protein
VDEQATAVGRWLDGDPVEDVPQPVLATSPATAAQVSEEILTGPVERIPERP